MDPMGFGTLKMPCCNNDVAGKTPTEVGVGWWEDFFGGQALDRSVSEIDRVRNLPRLFEFFFAHFFLEYLCFRMMNE